MELDESASRKKASSLAAGLAWPVADAGFEPPRRRSNRPIDGRLRNLAKP